MSGWLDGSRDLLLISSRKGVQAPGNRHVDSALVEALVYSSACEILDTRAILTGEVHYRRLTSVSV